MENKLVTVNSRSFDGSIRRTWRCELVERCDPMLVFVGTFESDVEHGDLGLIKKGTVSYEYYWLDRWYNIFRFHEPDGTFRNYYCNINMPPVFENGVLDYVDLDIDIVVWPDKVWQILDRDEFESNSVKFGYSDEIRAKVEETVLGLTEIIDRDKLPAP